MAADNHIAEGVQQKEKTMSGAWQEIAKTLIYERSDAKFHL